ncbi:MAG TPA: hypothetical protein VGC54_13520 [Planctomycetota bacterium]
MKTLSVFFRCGTVLAAFLGAAMAAAQGPPPDYATFEREQRIDYQPAPASLLRIWVVYVGQGDGILVQFPTRLAYDLPDGGPAPATRERLDLLIDGGSFYANNATRMRDFVHQLYPSGVPHIEHAVVTHHDADHVKGLAEILLDAGIQVDRVWHNGLASYRPGFPVQGAEAFPETGSPSDAVLSKRSDGTIARGMAYVVPGTTHLRHEYLLDSMSDLERERDRGALQGVFESLANAVLGGRPEAPDAYQRALVGRPFIDDVESAVRTPLADAGIAVELLWPRTELHRFGDWGETINGNSVTFRLVYGDFEMLFTGDHNEKSERALLDDLRSRDELDLLDCDVLKVPHHGSAHALEEFFRRPGFRPVLGVASMGEKGFMSKEMDPRAWQHPAEDVRRWVGQSHRFYTTLLQERRFYYEHLTEQAQLDELKEFDHVLIETDGHWFRVVEVPVGDPDPGAPPAVRDTRRGDGTRWIRAKRTQGGN